MLINLPEAVQQQISHLMSQDFRAAKRLFSAWIFCWETTTWLNPSHRFLLVEKLQAYSVWSFFLLHAFVQINRC